MSAAGAAFVNGTAVHGEDFDDTFEGGPVHAGAVVVPAVLAACERHGRDGSAALLGIAVGVETLCRLSLVAPKAVHKAGFHPTAVLGAVGAAAGVGAALGLDRRQLVDALGIVGSMASGIIEYLAEGAWTKRFHPGWAAQSGLRAALLGRAGFVGPRTVFEGVHGLFNGFAHTQDGDYAALTGDFGERWVTETLAFKPYPCGTMTHPYIDCARRLARARHPGGRRSRRLVCEVGGGDRASAVGAARRQAASAQRLCGQVLDPLLPRRRASCAAASASTRSPTRRCAIRLCSRSPPRCATRSIPTIPIRTISPATSARRLRDGTVVEERQPHLRGGGHEPLTPPRHRGEIRRSTPGTAAGAAERIDRALALAQKAV